MQQYIIGEHPTANSLQRNTRDLTEVGMSHSAMGSGTNSGPPGTGLILHREGQASRSEEAPEISAGGILPAPVLHALRRAQ